MWILIVNPPHPRVTHSLTGLLGADAIADAHFTRAELCPLVGASRRSL
jgi:hypothetical protein